MNLNLEVSIILPTLNESDNLKVIIPELVSELNKRKQINYEILIIDDGSKDNTHEVIKNLIKEIENLQIHIRKFGLPLTIFTIVGGGSRKSAKKYESHFHAR